MQGFTLSVQSVSLLPPSPSRLDSGLPATVTRLSPPYMPLSGVSLTPRHVTLNLSPYFLTLSVLSTLSAPSPYLTPKSLSNTQSLLNVLSKSNVVHLQWMPSHSSLPGNNVADFLAKVGASIDPSTISVSLSPLIFSQRLSLYTNCRRSVQSGLFQHKIPPVSPRSLLSFAPPAVFSLVYDATGTALSLALISTGLVKLRLLHAATVVLNHRTYFISC